MTNNDDAVNALRSVREVQQKAAARTRAPAYHHWAMGGVFLMLFVALELEENGASLVAIAMVLMAVLTSNQQKRSGVAMTGASVTGPKTKRIMWGGMATLIALMAAGLALKYAFDIDGTLIGLGVIAALLSTWFGFAWERSFIEEAGEA